MSKQLLIAGAGIGGMAAALAAARAGWEVRLFERAPVFAEVGAGVQLGPNAVRCLQAWGLEAALRAVAAFPAQLQVRSALSAGVLASLPLGPSTLRRYGAPYATIHRADLHGLLAQAVQELPAVQQTLDCPIVRHEDTGGAVLVRLARGKDIEGDVLVGADGLYSRTRAQLLGDGPPRFTGHLAYRALVPLQALPAPWRASQVTAWLGPRLHAVHYPVRSGAWVNLVVIVHGPAPQDLEHWDHAANAAGLEQALCGTHPELQEVVRSVAAAGGQWRLWPLCDRAPLARADDMARGLVALLGDAAHPMPPYLAQGAGMAIEDAMQLQAALAMHDVEVPLRLRRYALNRWQRAARVQARSQRNGRIFHATGPLRWARDAALRLFGQRLLDLPWLYRA
ncbi:FAD-dependent monooxygenase [Comamonas granuli]|uniref:FAD-dependent monooxygenase n=1 Tax=Comamonas granuli TaxID=290309 RepID=UPI0005A88F00|nr:FAD-dependent monooxygenase [Comamonas granuli]